MLDATNSQAGFQIEVVESAFCHPEDAAVSCIYSGRKGFLTNGRELTVGMLDADGARPALQFVGQLAAQLPGFVGELGGWFAVGFHLLVFVVIHA